MNNGNDLNLHSMTKLSGWLRYCSRNTYTEAQPRGHPYSRRLSVHHMISEKINQATTRALLGNIAGCKLLPGYKLLPGLR